MSRRYRREPKADYSFPKTRPMFALRDKKAAGGWCLLSRRMSPESHCRSHSSRGCVVVVVVVSFIYVYVLQVECFTEMGARHCFVYLKIDILHFEIVSIKADHYGQISFNCTNANCNKCPHECRAFNLSIQCRKI